MSARRFPWAPLLGLWVLVSGALLVACWPEVAGLQFADRDDYMRLLQVRDLTAGQSWFDLTQHRIDVPAGLSMHWSRLVDVPLLAFITPLRPLVGQALAERIAVAGAPLLTLLALMVAVASIVRALISKHISTALLACLFAIAAPTVLIQIHPARIDHHGWQIVFASLALAAVLDRRARRSGVLAGLAAALYLAISIEGAPFVAALAVAMAACWLARIDTGTRLTNFVATLAAGSLAATAAFAPNARWTEGACDAIGPAHLAALALLAPAVAIAVRWGERRGTVARALALTLAACCAFAALASIAPQCLADPYGAMPPIVRQYWFDNVREGLPFWRQTPIDALLAVVFPVVGLAGAVVGARAASSREMRRRWLVATLTSAATLATGALVWRAAGLAQIAAIPGALVLLRLALERAGRLRVMPLRAGLSAAAFLGASPLMPIVAAAAAVLPASPRGSSAGTSDPTGAYTRLAALPPTAIFAGLDLGPDLLANTPHRVHAAGYHRLGGPIADTIEVFLGPDEAAHAFLGAHDYRLLVFAPESSETDVYVRAAPAGFAAHLRAGATPAWLKRVDTGRSPVSIYRLTADALRPAPR